MKTMRRAIIAILLIVLVCATFVACNDDNNPLANENGYQLMDKKPFAKPDSSNEYDSITQDKIYTEEDEFDYTTISVAFRLL